MELSDFSVIDCRRWLRDTLLGTTVTPTWESPDGTVYPSLGDNQPSLLLHGLGDLADTAPVLELFTHNLFINTSGSGKTRILLEGLCANWGLYFTCVNASCGPGDIPDALDNLNLGDRTGFTLEAETDGERAHNYQIARRMFKAVFAARLWMLREYLQLLEEKRHEVEVPVARMRWVLAQVNPKPGPFTQLAKTLQDFSPQCIDEIITRAANYLCKVLQKEKVFIVIDEAQAGIELYPNSFPSYPTHGAKRPVLSVILHAARYIQCRLPAQTMIILAGTRNPYDSIKPVESSVAKNDGIRTFTKTLQFGFKDQRAYIARHLFPNRTTFSCSEETFFSRAWRYLGSSFRTTARFIELELVQQSPDLNESLNEYFRSLTGCYPDDVEDLLSARAQQELTNSPSHPADETRNVY